MSDWIGVAFFVLLIAGVIAGLKLLSKPKTRTSEEFERNAAEGTTMMGASMNALNELMNPSEAKAKEVVTQMKEGRYQKKKREGKAGGDAEMDGRGAAEAEGRGEMENMEFAIRSLKSEIKLRTKDK